MQRLARPRYGLPLLALWAVAVAVYVAAGGVLYPLAFVIGASYLVIFASAVGGPVAVARRLRERGLDARGILDALLGGDNRPRLLAWLAGVFGLFAFCGLHYSAMALVWADTGGSPLWAREGVAFWQGCFLVLDAVVALPVAVLSLASAVPAFRAVGDVLAAPSERDAAEEEARRALVALYSLAEDPMTGQVAVDTEGRYALVAGGLWRALGIDPPEVGDDARSEYRTYSDRSREAWDRMVAGEPDAYEIQDAASGRWFAVRLRPNLLPGAGYVTITDITEPRAEREELRRLREDAERRLRERAGMAAEEVVRADIQRRASGG